MKNIREIIISPVVTEKTTIIMEERNAYTFKVSLNANKIEIKKAIEKIFDVKVTAVNTIRQRGKIKSMGRYFGKKPDFKKAIVQLAENQSIPDFDVV